MVERRAGGECGVVAVQCLEGSAVWAARDAGMWPGDLAEAAVAAVLAKPRANLSQERRQAMEAMEATTMEASTVESMGPKVRWDVLDDIVPSPFVWPLSRPLAACSVPRHMNSAWH
jgi:hypothetical protein